MATDKEEFTRFFRAEYPEVVRTVYLLTQDREAAAAIARDAFARLYGRWKKVNDSDRPDAWVRRAAIRICRRPLTRMRRAARVPPQEEGGPRAAEAELVKTLAALPPNQRASIVLFYFEDRPVAELADMLGCSVSAAKLHLHRARTKLAEALGETLDDVSV